MAYIGQDLEYGALEKQTLTGNGVLTTFELNYIPRSATGLLVSVGGVIQEPDVAYTISGKNIVFTTAPAAVDIFVVFLNTEYMVSSVESVDYMDYQTGTGTGNTTPLVLTHSISNAEDIFVMLNGIKQTPDTDYTVSGTTLTFTSTVASGVKVMVLYLRLQRQVGVPLDGSVTNPKIVSMDAAKLTGSLPSSMSGDFTSQYQDISTLGLQWANVENKVAFNLTDDFMDVFQDSTGMDSGNTTNAVRDTSGEYVTSRSLLDTAENIAPSSNDWDYTFSNDLQPVSGNSLGDHTIGASIPTPAGSSGNIGIRTLNTFDGDFDITFTLDDSTNSEFGVHAIDEDHEAPGPSPARLGMDQMTNSFWYRDETVSDFAIGSSYQSDTHTFADGSVVKIERRSGTIKVYDDDVVVHTYGTTYSGTVRFVKGDPGPPDASYSNFKIVDYAKVQRDGFFNEAEGVSFGSGDSEADRANVGQSWSATRTGNVEEVKVNCNFVTTAGDYWCEIWNSDGTNPSSQVGSDSNTVTVSTTGDKTFVFSTPVPVIKGGSYWLILANATTGYVNWRTVAHTIAGGGKLDRKDAITSLSDNFSSDLAMEIKINTSTGEPTPDHDTLLLVQSNTTDGSTTFTDSSQNGMTVTANGTVQHDTTQAKFGATSILHDGNSDYLTIDDTSIVGLHYITIDMWVRPDTNGTAPLINYSTDGTTSTIGFYLIRHPHDVLEWQVSDGSTSSGTSTSATIVPGSWYHIAAVYSREAGVGIWVNGISEGTNTTTLSNGIQDKNRNVEIGFDFANRYWSGWMDEIRISRTARWEPGTNFTPPTAPYLTSTSSSVSATGSLVSTTSTADSTVSEATGVMVYKDGEGTNTIGTDLKAYFSADNGSNWTEAASYGNPTTFAGDSKVIPLGKTTVSNTGTQVKMKAEWANQVAGSGTEKTITAVGDVQHKTIYSKIGASSLCFDGTGDYLSIPKHTDFEFTGDFTAECWFYITSQQRGAFFSSTIEDSTSSGIGFLMELAHQGGGIYGIDVQCRADVNKVVRTSEQLNLNTWYHTAFVRSGTDIKLYLDGVEKDSNTGSTGTVQFPSTIMKIGKSREDTATEFDGYMDEVRISNVARYTSNFTPSTTAFTTDSDTVLLIHSDTTNGSTTFIDSSPIEGKIAQLHGWSVNY